MTQHVTEITDPTFNAQVLLADLPVVVLFYTTTCGPCREAIPMLDKLAAENHKIKFVKMNTDRGHENAQLYGVSGMPAFKIFKNGEVVGSYLGYTQQSRYQAWIEQSLGLPRTNPSVVLYG